MAKTLLDCTLRDGGFYNKWDFDDLLVERYLDSCVKSGIEFVELGYRNFPKNEFYGVYYYCSEPQLKRLPLDINTHYGVMVDAKTILQSDLSIADAVCQLFVPRDESSINFVRLACHFDELPHAPVIAHEIIKLGYEFFVNVMQVSGKSVEVLSSIGKILLPLSNNIRALYFADSLGCMDRRDISHVAGVLKGVWKTPLGIHAHNNRGQANANTISALESGVDFLDTTVAGMGRGAGNAQTEIILSELCHLKIGSYCPKAITALSMEWFRSLQLDLGWGPSIFYHIAAQNLVHPSYVQKMLDEFDTDTEAKVALISEIPKLAKASAFEQEIFNKFMNGSNLKAQAIEFDYPKLHSVKVRSDNFALLIGSGPTVAKFASGVRLFACQEKCISFSVNESIKELEECIDYYVLSHNVKRIKYEAILNKIPGKIIAPTSRFGFDELLPIETNRIFDYGLAVEQNKIHVTKNGCVIPVEITAAYALCAIWSMGIRKVFLVGFDGDFRDEAKNQQMSNVILDMSKEFPELEIKALTPTNYPIAQGSLFEPF